MNPSSRSPSRSEGEYNSSDSDAKAIRALPRQKDNEVDRQSRTDSFTRAHYPRSRSRSRSPYRASRGEKRRRNDEHARRNDTRTFGVRYDTEKHARPGSHRDRYAKRSRIHSPERSRSRSPYRRSEIENGRQARGNLKESVSERVQASEEGRNHNEHVAKTSDQNISRPKVINAEDRNPQPLLESISLDSEAMAIEARRKRREAIKNKFKGQEPSLLVQALRVGSEAPMNSTEATPTCSVSPFGASTSVPGTPQSIASGTRSPASTSSLKDDDMFTRDHDSPSNLDEPSAADYDPTLDMQEERARHEKRLFKEDEASIEAADRQVQEQTKQPSHDEPNDELDMFAEGDDDMFAEPSSKDVMRTAQVAKTLNATMLDNWDDPEGYYLTILGELIDQRYKVTQNLGRGMFASVIRAIDTKTDQTVAIKIIRNNESMRKAGVKEVDILQKLATNDPEDKLHIVRLLRSFDHKAHLCMVFENLSMNLREVLKKYGRDVGISLKSIRAYSQQLFRGLSLLRKCQLLHADLKPDNILVNESRSMVKIADLGSASPITENVTAPYLVSRFYRAPEVILGIEYDYGIDMWSIGCTLFELYTGKILFTGRNNNNMLRTIMECRGKFPNKLLRKGSLTYDYFDDLLNFKAIEPDKITGKMVAKTVDIKAKPIKDLRSRLIPRGKKMDMDEQEKKELELFVDLLDKCLALSPEKRITPSEALRHPFVVRPK